MSEEDHTGGKLLFDEALAGYGRRKLHKTHSMVLLITFSTSQGLL